MRRKRANVYDMTPAFPSTLKRLITLWDKHEEDYWGNGTAIEKWHDIIKRIRTWLKEESDIELLDDHGNVCLDFIWEIKDNIGRLGRLEITDKVFGDGWDVFFKFEKAVAK